MSGEPAKFRGRFLSLMPAERFQYIQQVTTRNNDTQITNLLSNLNVNDVDKRNSTRPDNIYFVTNQLAAFPNFKS